MSEMSRLSYTVAALSATGFASNVTGAVWAIATPGPTDGLAHHVTVHNDSATDHSAKTIILVGTGANGEALTETINAPAGSATVTSTKAFKTLTSATPSATIGADTFDIGWAATGHTPWVKLRDTYNPFSVSVAVYLTSGSLNFDGQITLEATPGEGSTAFNHTDMTGKTASAYAALTAPATGFRVDVNSHTNGVFTVVVNQAGHL